jgi:energy-converting hydrogenase Eha subunit F
MNRYLELLKSNAYKSISDYIGLFNVVNRLINKLRRPEIVDSIFCLPKNKANRIELDIIRLLNYNFAFAFALSPIQICDLNLANILGQ